MFAFNVLDINIAWFTKKQIIFLTANSMPAKDLDTEEVLFLLHVPGTAMKFLG